MSLNLMAGRGFNAYGDCLSITLIDWINVCVVQLDENTIPIPCPARGRIDGNAIKLF